MALFPLGILSAAGAGGVQGDYELIETYTLGSAQSQITFSSLATYASTYKHLQIRLAARSSRGSSDTVGIRFNGVTSSSYSYHFLRGNGSAVSSGGGGTQTFMYGFDFPGTNSATSAFGAGVIDILDSFSTTKNKTIRTLGGMNGAETGFIFLALLTLLLLLLQALNCLQLTAKTLLLAHGSLSTE
jgi:hypothetical protein